MSHQSLVQQQQPPTGAMLVNAGSQMLAAQQQQQQQNSMLNPHQPMHGGPPPPQLSRQAMAANNQMNKFSMVSQQSPHGGAGVPPQNQPPPGVVAHNVVPNSSHLNAQRPQQPAQFEHMQRFRQTGNQRDFPHYSRGGMPDMKSVPGQMQGGQGPPPHPHAPTVNLAFQQPMQTAMMPAAMQTFCYANRQPAQSTFQPPRVLMNNPIYNTLQQRGTYYTPNYQQHQIYAHNTNIQHMAMIPQPAHTPVQPAPVTSRPNKKILIINPATGEEIKCGPPASSQSASNQSASQQHDQDAKSQSPTSGPPPPSTLTLQTPKRSSPSVQPESALVGGSTSSPAPAAKEPAPVDQVVQESNQVSAPAKTPEASKPQEPETKPTEACAEKPATEDGEEEQRRKVEERNEENLRKNKQPQTVSTATPATQPEAASTATESGPEPTVAPNTAAMTSQKETATAVETSASVPPAAVSVPAAPLSKTLAGENDSSPVEADNKNDVSAQTPAAPPSSPEVVVASAAPVVNKSASPAGSETSANETKKEEIEAQDESVESEGSSAVTPSSPADSAGTASVYKEGQWSPTCPDGKKQYDRSFLLSLQNQPMSRAKPHGMPRLEIYKEISHEHTLPEKPGQSRSQQLYPNSDYQNRNGRNAPGSMGGGGNRKGLPPPRVDRPKKIITLSSSINQEVKLHVAENAWKPVKDVPENTDENDALDKKFRGILNKLTPQKFDSLVDQVKKLEINTEERLSNVTTLVLEKALNETHFASTYARLCYTLLTEFNVLKSESETSSGGGNTVNFRKMLLQKCQLEFERDTDDSVESKQQEKQTMEERKSKLEAAKTDQERKELQDSFTEADVKAKRRTLGLMRFIGELYNLSILNSNIMNDCFCKLMKNPMDEDSIVCACKLFTTVGRRFADESNGRMGNAQADNKTREKFSDLMEKLKQIIKDNRIAQKSGAKHLPQRVIFMLEDVRELSNRNWVPRRDEQAPKTLEQIQKDAEQEKILASIPQNTQSGSGGSGGGGRYGGSMHNTLQANRNNRPYGSQSQQSTSTFKSSKDIVMKLPTSINASGSSPFASGKPIGSKWTSGASGGGSRNSSLRGNRPEEPPMASANKYAALNTDIEPVPRSQESSPSRNLDRDRERGREQALQGARGLNQSGGLSRGGHAAGGSSTPSSRTASQSGPSGDPAIRSSSQQRSEAKSQGELKGPGLDDDRKLNAHAEGILGEFVMVGNVPNFLNDMCERAHVNNIQKFVSNFIGYATQKPSACQKTGEAIRELHKARLVSQKHVEAVLEEQFSNASDIIIDVPKYFDYMADIIAVMIVGDEFDVKTLLRSICAPLEHRAAKFLIPLFKRVNAMTKAGTAVPKWLSSGLKISDLRVELNESDSKGLSELLGVPGVESGSAKSTRSIEETVSDLQKDFSEQTEESIEKMKKLIQDAIEAGPEPHRQLIRAFVKMFLKCSLTEDQKFDKNLIDKNMESINDDLTKLFSDEYSIQALYALQLVMHELEHPKDVSSGFINWMYDNDFISESVLDQWSNKDGGHEQMGYRMTLLSAQKLLKWLKEC